MWPADTLKDAKPDAVLEGHLKYILAADMTPGETLLATGGGALLNAETRALVRDRAISVWIRANVDTLVKRATKRATRPLLKDGDPKEIISRLLEARTPFYAASDIAIDSDAGSHARTVRAIVDALSTFLGEEGAS